MPEGLSYSAREEEVADRVFTIIAEAASRSKGEAKVLKMRFSGVLLSNRRYPKQLTLGREIPFQTRGGQSLN